MKLFTVLTCPSAPSYICSPKIQVWSYSPSELGDQLLMLLTFYTTKKGSILSHTLNKSKCSRDSSSSRDATEVKISPLVPVTKPWCFWISSPLPSLSPSPSPHWYSLCHITVLALPLWHCSPPFFAFKSLTVQALLPLWPVST